MEHGMKVLVTGGAGYIGSHTCLELLRSGHEVSVVDSLYNGNAEALALIAQLKAPEKDVFGDADSETEEEEGPWTYNLPEEHKGLSTDGDAAVIKFGDKHYVVAMNWYEEAEDDDVASEEKVAEVSIGMLPKPTYPTEEGEDATGDFVVKA